MQIELVEVVANCVEPRLLIAPPGVLPPRDGLLAGHRSVARWFSRAEERPIGHDSPDAVAKNFPSIDVFAVEERLPVLRRKRQRCSEERDAEHGAHKRRVSPRTWTVLRQRRAEL